MDSFDKLPQTAAVKLRSYQKEMVDASLHRNTIVAMETGSGKTHVAIVRIAAELERCQDKLVFFLVPSVALAEQQNIVLTQGLPSYVVRTLTGRDGVEKWTSQSLWDAILTNIHVVVCTPAVLLDALTHAFVTLGRISLCVFDEAHRATKGHPMNAIMQRFYHPAKSLGSVPHILGLTASPVVNSKKGSLEIIERNLDSISTTPKVTRSELEKYVNPPEVTVVAYASSLKEMSDDPMCGALMQEVTSYSLQDDSYVMELTDMSDSRSIKLLQSTIKKNETYCLRQLRALDQRTASVCRHLGLATSRWYLEQCINVFQASVDSGDAFMPDLTDKERLHLSTILARVQAENRHYCENSGTGHTDKVTHLIDVLRAHAVEAPSIIIFVEQRVHTLTLAHLLEEADDIRGAYRIGTFVGTSTSSKRKVSLADIVEPAEQQNDLAAFRRGEKNLMIATSVLEEGIDISACSLVICFDPPKNLISFVQRRGRARQMNSKYFVFVQEDDLKQQGTQWERLEAEMKQAYMNDSRQIAEALEGESGTDEITYRIPSTGALLTLDNAKGHLYHFCSVGIRHASNYADLRPEFDTDQDVSTNLWTATVELPAFVHPEVRHASSSAAWRHDHTAIAHAAFEAYAALHKAGLVNDNLLPLVKDYGPDVGRQHIDQPSLVMVSERLSWETWCKDLLLPTAGWSRMKVSIELDCDVLVDAVLLVPSLSPSQSINLYWNANTQYVARLQQVNGTLEVLHTAQLSILKQSTRAMLQAVHGNRMASAGDDFAFLLAPDDPDIAQWLQNFQGHYPANSLSRSVDMGHDIGLVRVRGEIGKSFFLSGFEGSISAESGLTSSINTTTFPKRRDFLHPINDLSTEHAAYTSQQCFATSDCTIDKLPSKYALLAAFIPSILHRVDTALLVQALNGSLPGSSSIDNVLLLLEAITSPAAGESMDYNRLEYLGDTILKHITELQVMSQHSTWPEAYLTAERDRIVRNSNLAAAALEVGLDKFIITKQFTGAKWRPIHIGEVLSAEGTKREMSTKTLADVMEAIIGALFVDGGLVKAQRCAETLLQAETWQDPTTIFDDLVKELRPMAFENRGPLERLVGHAFAHPTLLLEALTHASYPNIQTGLSYERLEFLGDSVSDMIITPRLFAHRRKLKHWELHRIHEALVNSHFLGYCCMRYAVEEEIFNVVGTSTNEHEIRRTTRQVHLHDFLRAGHQLQPFRRASISAFQDLDHDIHQGLVTEKRYPWTLLFTFSPHKFFCDIAESVLGAIYIDTRGDLSVCEAFVAKLGILDYMEHILDDHVECINPKERLGAVADRDAVKYVNSRKEGEDGKKTSSCTVWVGEKEVVTVDGCGNRDEAEVKAAFQACEILGDKVGEATGKKKRKLDAAFDHEHVASGAEVEMTDGDVVLD